MTMGIIRTYYGTRQIPCESGRIQPGGQSLPDRTNRTALAKFDVIVNGKLGRGRRSAHKRY